MQRVKVAHVVLPKRRCLFVLAKPQMQRMRHPCRSKGKHTCKLEGIPRQCKACQRSLKQQIVAWHCDSRLLPLKALSREETSLQRLTCDMAESGCHRAAKAAEAAGHHELQAPQRFQCRHGRLRLHACPQPEHDHPLVHLQGGFKVRAGGAAAARFRRGAHHMPGMRWPWRIRRRRIRRGRTALTCASSCRSWRTCCLKPRWRPWQPLAPPAPSLLPPLPVPAWTALGAWAPASCAEQKFLHEEVQRLPVTVAVSFVLCANSNCAASQDERRRHSTVAQGRLTSSATLRNSALPAHDTEPNASAVTGAVFES